MSFLRKAPQRVKITIYRGFDYGPRTFEKRHGPDYSPAYDPYVNDGFEARLEARSSKGGDPVFILDSLDSGSGLSIDHDVILITLELTPSQTDALDFDCCYFDLFIYKDDASDPSSKKPIVSGEMQVI